ncbi:MAG TPA: hypothetical protein VEC37_01405 [Bacillota bacterium]|nr:hypothetical protein [Bacillota bacterium]
MSSNGFEFDFKPMLRKIQSNPGSVWFLLGLIGLGLFLLAGTPNRQESPDRLTTVQKEQTQVTEGEQPSAELKLEREITGILRQIAGVGRVRVDVSLKTANRKIWERQTRSNKRISQQQGEMDTEESNSDELVFAKNREGTDVPVLKEELAPEVQGVLVVADGAQNTALKQLLTETVMTILDLPSHRVMVIAGKDELK